MKNRITTFIYIISSIFNYTLVTHKENLISNKNITSAIFLLDKKVDPEEFLQRIKAIALYFNSLSKDEI